MSANAAKLTSIVEEYLAELRRLRDSGGATGELSTYPALANLIDAVGATLRPKVFCVVGLANQGAGHPDIGLYADDIPTKLLRARGHAALAPFVRLCYIWRQQS